MTGSYELIDSGDKKKLEKWGDYLLCRPSSQALWQPCLSQKEWALADASFIRDKKNQWVNKRKMPESWCIKMCNKSFLVRPTDFGHLGIFPEHEMVWKWMEKKLKRNKNRNIKVLNLFGYTGGASLVLASLGAFVCHVDASKPSVEWAKENARINKIDSSKIRWIVDDAMKFLKREKKRSQTYDAIILDPPTFGRGTKKEVFKIEERIFYLLQLCKNVLSTKPLFVVFTSHTSHFSPLVMANLLKQIIGKDKEVSSKEMMIVAKKSFSLPCGTCAIWEKE